MGVAATYIGTQFTTTKHLRHAPTIGPGLGVFRHAARYELARLVAQERGVRISGLK